jgi:hypothetical protein
LVEVQQLNLKPTHAAVKAYYQALGQYGQLDIDHEMAVRGAFQHLLEKCGRQFNWTLIAEYPLPRPKAAPLKVDGALLDEFRLKRGLWEAKDGHDDLERESKRKISAGYPTDNIIFQAPERAILYQNGVRQGLSEDISNADNLVDLLHRFFEYRQPHLPFQNLVRLGLIESTYEADGMKVRVQPGHDPYLSGEMDLNRWLTGFAVGFIEACRAPKVIDAQ